MVYGGMVDTAKKRGNGEIDFGDLTKYLKDIISEADLAVCNFEATLPGNKNYSYYPCFNVPDEIADTLKDAGFDALLFANNHMYDTGHDGFIRTQNFLREKGFDVYGARSNTNEKSYGIRMMGDVKLGMLDYTYEAPSKGDGTKNLNGIKVDDTDVLLIDSFGDAEMTKFYTEVDERIKELKQNGAELIVFFIHWGTEYEEHETGEQKAIANKLCELGVDILIGSHPHVVEPVDIITSADGHKMLCYYSLGNFTCSVNRVTYPAHGEYVENELLAKVTIRKYSDGRAVIEKADYEPVWQHYHTEDGRIQANMVPLRLALENEESIAAYALNKSSAGVKNARAAYEYITNLVQPGIDKFNANQS